MKKRYLSIPAIALATLWTVTAVQARPQVAHVDAKIESPTKPQLKANQAAWHAALAFLHSHGMNPQPRREALATIEDFEPVHAAPFFLELVIDLRFGGERDAMSVEQHQQAMEMAWDWMQSCDAPAACMQQAAARHPDYALVQMALKDNPARQANRAEQLSLMLAHMRRTHVIAQDDMAKMLLSAAR